MLSTALEILNKIEEFGYKAYVVGGFVRDLQLGIESMDVDICTSATPKELTKIFDGVNLKNEKYGSLTVFYKNIRFEITTFRKELKYIEARKPIDIEYISDLKEDLQRRDFTMNTLCIDANGALIDLFNAKLDIDKHLIKTVGEADQKLKEDALRILRAIRFISQLGFDLDENARTAISNNKKNLQLLTNHRKKQELSKIFTGKYADKAIKEMNLLKLEDFLDIKGLNNIIITNDINSMWAQLDLNLKEWEFSKLEIQTIKKIRELLKLDEINDYTLYKEGLYLCKLAYQINGGDYKSLSKRYNDLVIKNKKEIKLKAEELISILKVTPSNEISKIIEDIEINIINKVIKNTKKDIINYIKNKY